MWYAKNRTAMKKMITLGLALLLLAAGKPAAAQKKLEPFVFTTQWTAQAQFAGYYVAQEKPRRCSAPGPPSAAR